MGRLISMMACFAIAGLNIWVIASHHGGPLNYVGATMALGAGVYSMASLVRYP